MILSLALRCRTVTVPPRNNQYSDPPEKALRDGPLARGFGLPLWKLCAGFAHVHAHLWYTVRPLPDAKGTHGLWHAGLGRGHDALQHLHAVLAAIAGANRPGNLRYLDFRVFSPRIHFLLTQVVHRGVLGCPCWPMCIQVIS